MFLNLMYEISLGPLALPQNFKMYVSWIREKVLCTPKELMEPEYSRRDLF